MIRLHFFHWNNTLEKPFFCEYLETGEGCAQKMAALLLFFMTASFDLAMRSGATAGGRPSLAEFCVAIKICQNSDRNDMTTFQWAARAAKNNETRKMWKKARYHAFRVASSELNLLFLVDPQREVHLSFHFFFCARCFSRKGGGMRSWKK